jgi:SAM-dependent methyltransferase
MTAAAVANAASALAREWPFVCLSCRGALAMERAALACQGCSSAYPIRDGIPTLLPQRHSEQKEKQVAFFDEGGLDEEFERERPFGSPVLYGWLLAERFRRSVAHLSLEGMTALVICGGSGMDAELLARRGARVLTSDVSFGASCRARERGRRHGVAFDVVVADAELLPLPDQSIDVVYVHDGLHHLERPLDGLAEMARVARVAVCVTEPARAALTAMAVRLGWALEREEAGNRVARLGLDEVRSTLAASGFHVVMAERYGMYYRHEPGRLARFLSHQPLLALSQVSLRIANSVAGRLGNKLTLQAVREPVGS